MTDYFKYLVSNPDDQNRGLYLTVAGQAHIGANKAYPPEGHPRGYSFNWETGRVLREHVFVYITEGEGVFENRNGLFQVPAGSAVVIPSDSWHRYKPVPGKGWTEYYIGIAGKYADPFVLNGLFSEKKPVVPIGYDEKIIRSFYEIFELTKLEQPGYQQVCSGLAIYMLGLIHTRVKNINFDNKQVIPTIQKACIYFRVNLTTPVDLEQLASKLDIGYTTFRKEFKKYTGLSPSQYHLALRIQQAKDLLVNTGKSIKEIAFELGFSSEFHFSKLFKEKAGITPSQYRKLK
jgi:AraC-like DNA-binding protein